MLKISFSLFFCLLLKVAVAQESVPSSKRQVVHLNQSDFIQVTTRGQDGSDIWKTKALEMPDWPNKPFIAVSVVWKSNSDKIPFIQLSFYDAGTEKEKIEVGLHEHGEFSGSRKVSELYFIESEAEYFTISCQSAEVLNDLEIHFYHPGITKAENKVNQLAGGNQNLSCLCVRPEIKLRSFWCPDGSCKPVTSTTKVTHLIVHHSAGTNSSSDWAAVVRSIWDFHVNINLWSDIGYNWLIDPNGVIYEGRGDNILGAHFCGKNTGTAGVCVLGNFMTVAPSASSLKSLKDLYAWKACDAGIDPLGAGFHSSSGLNLNIVSGHRDGCSTSCPGDMLYPLLPSIRDSINRHIQTQCSLTSAESSVFTEMSFQVFPNPTDDQTSLILHGEYIGLIRVSAYDAFGRKVQNEGPFEKSAHSTALPIQFGNNPPGLYLLRIEYGKSTQYARVILN